MARAKKLEILKVEQASNAFSMALLFLLFKDGIAGWFILKENCVPLLARAISKHFLGYQFISGGGVSIKSCSETIGRILGQSDKLSPEQKTILQKVFMAGKREGDLLINLRLLTNGYCFTGEKNGDDREYIFSLPGAGIKDAIYKLDNDLKTICQQLAAVIIQMVEENPPS